MPGVSQEWRISDEALMRDLRGRLMRLERREPAMNFVGLGQAQRVRDRFIDQEGPGREPWTPLAPVTIEKREKDGFVPIRILSERGDLAGSIVHRADDGGFVIGTDGSVNDYAAIHQFGGQAGRGLAVMIPARPYLGFDDEDQELIAEELLDYLAGSA